MIVLVDNDNISLASKAFSASWRFSHNGIVSNECLDMHDPDFMKQVILDEQKKGNLVYTAMEANYSTGIISFSLKDNHVSKLYVHAAYLRQGIGRALMSFAMDMMDKSREITVISLDVNLRARRFYESLGFKYTGTSLLFKENESVTQMLYSYKL